MQLTAEQVLKIADLAKLELQPEEVESYRLELSTILEFVEQLNQVDTTSVLPTSQVTGLENQTRPDQVNYEFTRQQMLASAIETAEDHVKVKSILKKS